LRPRKDHRGWNTPNEASRILLIFVLVIVSYWAWPISDGMIYMWLTIIIMVSTFILSIGWLILSYASQNRESRKLTPSVGEKQS
jgi:hypothetical protein